VQERLHSFGNSNSFVGSDFAVTNPQQTFKDARLKVERADCHIRECTETIIAFLKTDFCKLTVEEDGDTGHYLIKADAAPIIHPCSQLSLGDVVHNLRTALDYIIVEFTGLDPDWINRIEADSSSFTSCAYDAARTIAKNSSSTLIGRGSSCRAAGAITKDSSVTGFGCSTDCSARTISECLHILSVRCPRCQEQRGGTG
jgi:hypothetical protein